MKIRYEQLTPREALETYCDWLMTQMPPDDQTTTFGWYRLFYPLRTLLLGAKLLDRPEYAEAAFHQMDRYVGEQLPNGAFTANYRNVRGDQLTQAEIEDILRTGLVNLADNGSNVHGLLQGAFAADPERRAKYLAAARKWLDCWVPIWALPNGAYGNGIWAGHKLNGPYSMAINVCSAFAAFTLITGEEDYIHKAEKFAMFQCDNWHPCGVPIRFNLYPKPDDHTLIGDFSRVYYMLEGLCWTHYVSKDESVRSRIAERLTEWIEKDLLKRWPDDREWFHMGKCNLRHIEHGDYGDSNDDAVSFFWQAAKCAGIPHLFSYYLDHIEDRTDLRSRVELGKAFLCHPLKAHILSVMADQAEPTTCLQATGFAGLTVASAVDPASVFNAYKFEA